MFFLTNCFYKLDECFALAYEKPVCYIYKFYWLIMTIKPHKLNRASLEGAVFFCIAKVNHNNHYVCHVRNAVLHI